MSGKFICGFDGINTGLFNLLCFCTICKMNGILMLEKLFEMIRGYASEEGFTVCGTRLASKQCYYDLTVSQRHITVYLNGKTEPFYLIETVKDGVDFCLIMSSVEQTRKVCIHVL